MDQRFRHSWVILETVVGSRAYGLDTPTSDYDLKGVAIAPIESYLGFNSEWTGTSDRLNLNGLPMERTWYEIRRFFAHCANGSSESLDVLFAPDVRILSSEGESLLRIRDRFLSRKVKHSYTGYAHAQLKKLRNQPSSAQAGKQAAHVLRLMTLCKEMLSTGKLQVCRTGIDAEDLKKVRNEWSPDKLSALEEQVKDLETELDVLYEDPDCPLPHRPDHEALNDWLVSTLRSRLQEGRSHEP